MQALWVVRTGVSFPHHREKLAVGYPIPYMQISTGAICSRSLNKLAIYYLGNKGNNKHLYIFSTSEFSVYRNACVCMFICMCMHCVCVCVCVCVYTWVGKRVVHSVHMSMEIRGHSWCQMSSSKHRPPTFETESLACISPNSKPFRIHLGWGYKRAVSNKTLFFFFECMFLGSDPCPGASMWSTFLTELSPTPECNFFQIFSSNSYLWIRSS